MSKIKYLFLDDITDGNAESCADKMKKLLDNSMNFANRFDDSEVAVIHGGTYKMSDFAPYFIKVEKDNE